MFLNFGKRSILCSPPLDYINVSFYSICQRLDSSAVVYFGARKPIGADLGIENLSALNYLGWLEIILKHQQKKKKKKNQPLNKLEL